MLNTGSCSDKKFHQTMLLILALFYLFVYILPLGLRDMMIPDEFRYGEIPREMVANNDWVTPELVGVRYFEKPALGYQWTALCLKIFGENAFAVRLPSALSVGLTMLLIYWLCARQQRDRFLAPLAAMIYMSFAFVYGVGTFAVLDSQLTMALTWCIGGYFLAWQSKKMKNYIALLVLAGLAAGAAFLFKGFLAFAVPVVVIAPFLIWQKDWKKFLTDPWIPLVLTVAVALPWSIAIWKAEPDFWNYFFIEEHIKRFTSGTYDRKPEPFWFFIPILLGGMLPGGLLLLGTWRGFSKAWFKEPLERFCLCWTVMPFLLFSIGSCKTGTYILPCFPPLAILLASLVLAAKAKISEKHSRLLNTAVNLIIWIFAVCGIAGTGLMIVWRFFLVHKLPLADPAAPWALVAMLLAAALAGVFYYVRQKDFRIQIMVFLGGFVLLCSWGASGFVNDAHRAQKMPGDTLKTIFQELQITDNDVITLDRRAASVAAWVLKRQDMVVIDHMGEFKYGFTKYPEEYAKRHYSSKELPRLLKDYANRRIFYVSFRDPDDKRVYPQSFRGRIKNMVSKKGVTVVEIAR